MLLLFLQIDGTKRLAPNSEGHFAIFGDVLIFIAMCIYRLVTVNIDLSETAQKAHWKSETTSKTIFFSDNLFFPTKFYFRQKIFSRIFSRTEFRLGLHTAVVFRMQLFIITF